MFLIIKAASINLELETQAWSFNCINLSVTRVLYIDSIMQNIISINRFEKF